EKRSDFAQTPAGFHGATNDLVINVGDVAYIGDAISGGAQPALDDVEAHQHASVAQMTEIVDSHAAYIHAHMTRFDRTQRFLVASEGIMYLQHLPSGCSSSASHAHANLQAGEKAGSAPGNGPSDESTAKMVVFKYSKTTPGTAPVSLTPVTKTLSACAAAVLFVLSGQAVVAQPVQPLSAQDRELFPEEKP